MGDINRSRKKPENWIVKRKPFFFKAIKDPLLTEEFVRFRLQQMFQRFEPGISRSTEMQKLIYRMILVLQSFS